MDEPRIPMPQALYDEFGNEVTDKVQDFVRQHILADRERRTAAEVAPEVLKRYAAWASEFAAQHGHPPTAAEVFQTLTAGVGVLGHQTFRTPASPDSPDREKA